MHIALALATIVSLLAAPLILFIVATVAPRRVI
jgi:hypothetical protein